MGEAKKRYRTYVQNFDEDIPRTPKRRRKHNIKMDLREVSRDERRLASLSHNSVNTVLSYSGANHPRFAVSTVSGYCISISPTFPLHSKLITSSYVVSKTPEVFMP
jgi:hypothetical protein